jgi:hypothetical protein
MTNEHRQAMLQAHVAALSEHFDCVQIVASFPTGPGNQFTGLATQGSGNWFARVKMCEEFAATYRRRELADTIAQRMTPPGDGEAWRGPR